MKRPNKEFFVPRMPKKTIISGMSEERIVESANNFMHVERVHHDVGDDVLLDKVKDVVYRQGLPLLVTGYNKHAEWDENLFSEAGTWTEFNRYTAGKSKRS